MEIQQVTVIGAGTMGNGIAQVFAQAGFRVTIADIDQQALQKGMQTITASMDRLVKKEKLTQEQKDSSLDRIRTFTALEGAVAGSQLVIEAATENKELKQRIFRQLDGICPAEVVFATNTSSISITEIAAATQRPERFIGMHFMNPVPVMKLVEVIRGYQTTQEVTDLIIALTGKLEKVPLVVNDYPGFIANRILMPMINEAICALYEGVAGIHEIDQIMKLGMAHPMGPLELADFIGLDVCLAILRVMHDGLGNPKYAPCPLLVNMVNAGQLGRKKGRGFYDYAGSAPVPVKL